MPHVDLMPRFIFDALWLAIPCGATSVFLLSSMLKTERVGFVTISTSFAVPVVALVVQSLPAKELPNPVSLVGCGVLLAGIYLAISE